MLQVNVRTHTHRTPLHAAIAAGHTGCVRALLSSGADIRAVDKMGNNPLHECANHGRAEALELIVETQNILLRQSERRRLLLQQQQQQQQQQEHQPQLQQPVVGGEAWLREMMWARDAVGQLPLHAAAVNGHVVVLDRLLALLLSGGPPPAAAAAAAAAHCKRRGRSDAGDCADGGGSGGGGDGDDDDEDHERRLLINATDSTGCTALHLAAVQGHAACVVRLVETGGADVEARTPPPGSRTPLHCAAGWGKLGAVRALAALKADVGAVDGAGRTVLEVARLGHAQGAKGARGWTNAEVSSLPAIATLLEVAAAALEPAPPPEE